MRSLPVLFAWIFLTSSWAQIQVPVPSEPSDALPTASPEEQIWRQSGLLTKPKDGMSDQALRMVKIAAESNDTEALMKLAAMAASNMDAFEYVHRAAELGNAKAEYELASMYAQGRGVPKSLETALLWGRKAAAGGDPLAQYSLGLTLLRTSAGKTEKEAGLDWIRKASEAGYAPAALNLAKIYATGEYEVTIDEARAEALLKPLADSDDAECQFALASLYYFGKTYGENRNLAIVWLKRAKANGHPTAEKVLQEVEEETSRAAKP